MNFNQIHHIAIIGSDYEKSRHFYVDLLGFRVIRENYRPQRNDIKLDLRLGDAELEIFCVKANQKTKELFNSGFYIRLKEEK